MNRNISACLVLAIATLAVYWPVSGHRFISYDDLVYVAENQVVHQGLSFDSVYWALTSTEHSNWHPLTWMSHMIDCQLFGLDNPGAHHLTNLFFHTVNSLLMFFVFRYMTGSFWPPLFVASMFALHPLHVESVAWLAERKDVLSTLFWLASMLSYTAYARQRRGRWYLITLILLALGLMSKPMLVTAPFLFLLLDYWPLARVREAVKSASEPLSGVVPVDHEQRSWAQLIVEKIPLFLIVAASSWLTYYAQRQGEAAHFVYPLGHRLVTTVMAYNSYLSNTFWPVRLSIFYPNHVGMWSPAAVAAGTLWLAFVTVVVIRYRHRRYLLVGWLWFLGTLVPVIGLVSIGQQARADRYMYIPMTGLTIMIAWGVVPWCQQAVARRDAVACVAAAAIIGCLWLTSRQVALWQDGVTLYAHALQVTDRNHVMHNSLGVALDQQGRKDEALDHFREAVRIRYEYPKGLYNLARALHMRGKRREAIETYQALLRMSPADTSAHLNLGVALHANNQPQQAISHFQNVLEITPDHPTALYNLARTLASVGQIDRAIAYYRQSLGVAPKLIEAHNNLAILLVRQGESDAAVGHFREALRIDPEYAPSHKNLAGLLASRRDYDQAIRHLQVAIQVDPQDHGARQMLRRMESLRDADD